MGVVEGFVSCIPALWEVPWYVAGSLWADLRAAFAFVTTWESYFAHAEQICNDH